ncbi:MAG: TIGR02996 domain-containing protein [Fimbriiglobus sp.]
MLTDHEAFIEAILEDPTDNLRKLAYADWLEEQGDYVEGIRARLIRLEIEALPMQFGSEERRQVQREITQLKERYNWLLKPNMPPGFDARTEETCLMVFRANLTVTRFVEWGTDYLRGMPPYCRIDLTLSRKPAAGTMLRLLDSVAWSRVVGLSDNSDYRWSLEEMQRLADDPRLNSLQELMLWGRANQRVTSAHFPILLRSPNTRRLEQLYWYCSSVEQGAIEILKQPQYCPRLRTLNLVRSQLSDRDTEEIRNHRPELTINLHS